MKIGIIGLPQAGKKTLYELLTKHRPSEKELSSHKPVRGISEIDDPRFDRLVSIYKPKKEAKARIEFELIPKLEKEATSEHQVFSAMEELDGVLYVARSFKDDTVYHVEGSVDPKRDIDAVNEELILNDLIFAEKRLEKLDKLIKQTGEEAAVKEKDLLLKLKAHLDRQMPLRLAPFSADELKAISAYPLVTRKPLFVVLNIGEDEIGDKGLVERFRSEYKGLEIDLSAVAAKDELEISGFESEEERAQFAKELGIEEPAAKSVGKLCMKALGLISFFTVKSEEVRQWTIKAGAKAHEAAGVIHSDMERGFIRAEVIKYADIDALGSEEKTREAGKLYVKGKDYVVEDGDIISVRFSV